MIRRTYRWRAADWARWFCLDLLPRIARACLPWLALGVLLGVIATTTVNHLIP